MTGTLMDRRRFLGSLIASVVAAGVAPRIPGLLGAPGLRLADVRNAAAMLEADSVAAAEYYFMIIHPQTLPALTIQWSEPWEVGRIFGVDWSRVPPGVEIPPVDAGVVTIGSIVEPGDIVAARLRRAA